jgi:two-component system, cell cycle response regulator DivK
MRKRLLIVEDSELNRDLMVQIFEGAYDIDVAADGATAVALAASSPPDLILMDIGLPGLNGLDAAREIRSGYPDLPIIAVSSRIMPGDRERALEAGCNDFVGKPIDDVLLLEMVGRLLGSR